MNWASNEVVAVLAFLLPGFVAAAVFYSLTCWPRPGAFERIVSALIFTALGYAITEFGLWAVAEICGTEKTAESDETVEAIGAWKPLLFILVAAALGVGFAFLSNADILHRPLRWARITRETSHPSEWYSAFARLGDSSFVVLHLQGERRLYGYAEEWPSNPGQGHFRIVYPVWLGDEGERSPAEGVTAILIPVAEVSMVEFVPYGKDEDTE